MFEEVDHVGICAPDLWRTPVARNCETNPKGRAKTKPLTSEQLCLNEMDHVTPYAKQARHTALL